MKNILFTMLMLMVIAATHASNIEPNQRILIFNRTDQLLYYKIYKYHEVYQDEPESGYISPHSSQTINMEYDFYYSNDGSGNPFCEDYNSGQATNCSSFIIDLIPNLIDKNDSIRENPITMRFIGDTPDHSETLNTMTAFGFNNNDSHYNLSYAMQGAQPNSASSGTPMMFATQTRGWLNNFNIYIDQKKLANNTPAVKTTFIANNTALESHGYGKNGDLYKVDVDLINHNAITPPLNGVFYQVKTGGSHPKTDYFYPNTGLIYNDDGTISPNNFSFYIHFESDITSYTLSECTSDFMTQNSSSEMPLCHHLIWQQKITLPKATSQKQSFNISSITLTPFDNTLNSIYNNGSFALPVIVTLYDQDGIALLPHPLNK